MIRRSLLVTGLLLVLYTGFIYWAGPAISRTAQTTAQRNVIKAEDYLYDTQALYDTVVVGSSMSERLMINGTRLYNLSLAGQSSIEGLRLVVARKKFPRVLLVETNSLARQEPTEPDLLALTDSARFNIKRYLPFLQLKYQPVGVVKALLRDWQYGRNQAYVPETALNADTALLAKTVAQQVPAMEQPILPDTLHKLLTRARPYLEPMQQAGTTVIFFTMPIDARLQRLPAPTAVRQAAKAIYSGPGYRFIPLPESPYGTTDGVHLLHPESIRYTAYVQEQLRQSQP